MFFVPKVVEQRVSRQGIKYPGGTLSVHLRNLKQAGSLCNYFTIRGGSLKKIAKNIIPNVPTNKKV